MTLSKKDYKRLFDESMPWAALEDAPIPPPTQPEIPLTAEAAAAKVQEFLSRPPGFPVLPPYETPSRASSRVSDISAFYPALVAFLESDGIPFVIDADFYVRALGDVAFEVRFYSVQATIPASMAWTGIHARDDTLVDVRRLGGDRDAFAALATRLASACGLDFGPLTLTQFFYI